MILPPLTLESLAIMKMVFFFASSFLYLAYFFEQAMLREWEWFANKTHLTFVALWSAFEKPMSRAFKTYNIIGKEIGIFYAKVFLSNIPGTVFKVP